MGVGSSYNSQEGVMIASTPNFAFGRSFRSSIIDMRNAFGVRIKCWVVIASNILYKGMREQN